MRISFLIILWLASTPLFSATQLDVFDFKKNCVSELDLAELYFLPRVYTNISLPQYLHEFLVTDIQDLQGKAKTAYYNALHVDEFFSKELNWESADNRQSPIIILSNLEVDAGDGCNALNATFGSMHPELAQVMSIYFGHRSAYEDIADDIDVIGHEYAHGLFQATQEYRENFEKGSINEGVGDIFGSTIRAWHESGGDLSTTRLRQDSFNVGKNIGIIISKYYHERVPAGSMRDNLDPGLDSPSPGADHYSQIYEGHYYEVHSAGAVVSHAYALLVKGGTVSTNGSDIVIKGIGFEKAIKIVFHTLKNKLPFNTMPEFANAVKKSAKIIHGENSREVVAVHNAFTAVGLFERAIAEPVPPEPVPPEPVPPEPVPPEPVPPEPVPPEPVPPEPVPPEPVPPEPVPPEPVPPEPVPPEPVPPEPVPPEPVPPEPVPPEPVPPEPVPPEPVQSPLKVSGPTMVSILGGFLTLMLIAAVMISRNRRQQIILQAQQQVNATTIEPGQAFEVQQETVNDIHPPQAHHKIRRDIPTKIIRSDISSANGSIAVTIIAGSQSFVIELDDSPVILGRGSHLNLPTALKACLAGDEYIAREHSQVWYKAITHELYVLCLTANGVTVDGQTLSVNTKGKVNFDHPVQLILGKTTISISPR